MTGTCPRRPNGIGIALIISGNWMLHTLMTFTVNLFERIPTLLS